MDTSLRFLGDLKPWSGLLLAAALAAGAWFLYRRETRDRADCSALAAPHPALARSLFDCVALDRPVLHHERVIRELGRLFVFIDGSESMEVVDAEMPLGRKAAAMQAAGYLPRSRAFRGGRRRQRPPRAGTADCYQRHQGRGGGSRSPGRDRQVRRTSRAWRSMRSMSSRIACRKFGDAWPGVYPNSDL